MPEHTYDKKKTHFVKPMTYYISKIHLINIPTVDQLKEITDKIQSIE